MHPISLKSRAGPSKQYILYNPYKIKYVCIYICVCVHNKTIHKYQCKYVQNLHKCKLYTYTYAYLPVSLYISNNIRPNINMITITGQ